MNGSGSVGAAEIRRQLDIGIGDAVVPEAGWVEYPVLLDLPHPRILACSPVTSVAEKLHAMVVWGLANSRMKDYYDIWFLATNVRFDGPQLVAAITSTFKRRAAELPTELPVSLTRAFWNDGDAERRWKAFASHLGTDTVPAFREVVEHIAGFVDPALRAAVAGEPFEYRWAKGGPWRPRKT